MRAAVTTRYGLPEVVEVREVPTPTPADNEVLVRVRASSVCYGDRLFRSGPFLIRLVTGFRRPPKHKILGVDLAGVVEAVGAAVTQAYDVIVDVLGTAGFPRSVRALKPGGRYVLVGFSDRVGSIARDLATGALVHVRGRARFITGAAAPVQA